MKALPFLKALAVATVLSGLSGCTQPEGPGSSNNPFVGTWQSISRPYPVLQIEPFGKQVKGRFIYLGRGSRIVVQRLLGVVEGSTLAITAIDQVPLSMSLSVSLDQTGALVMDGEPFERVSDEVTPQQPAAKEQLP